MNEFETKKSLREMKVSVPFLHGISQGLLLLCNFINMETDCHNERSNRYRK